MSVLKTKSFELGVYAKGDENAPKLALVLPGLLDTKDYPHMRSHVDFLAQHGYYAISFDMPGTWETSDDINEYNTTNCLKAIAELIEKYNRPTFVMGHSNGGRLSTLAAVRNPEIEAFAAIMSSATFVRASNYQERMVGWKEEGIKVSKRDLPENPEDSRTFNLPFAFCDDALKYDAREGLDKLDIPKLFILGEHDPTVTPEEVEEVFESAGEPKQLIRLNSDHNYRWHPKLIEEVNGYIGAFLDGNK